MAYLNTLNNYHLVQQLLLFRHHDQQLHDRNHKGPQRIELHQYQSHLTVTKYRSKLSITPTYQKEKKKKKLSLQVYIKNWWKLNAIISPKKARKQCSFQIEIILRHTNHLLITETVHIYQKTITLFQTIHKERERERERENTCTQKKIVLYFYTRKHICS